MYYAVPVKELNPFELSVWRLQVPVVPKAKLACPTSEFFFLTF